jgi:two-component system response regulator YesN
MIIVDDEYIILDSLKTLVDWASIGVEVVGTADNGAAAIDLTLKQKPDIVLSDISMPYFSGLEMLETLRRHNLSVEVIFISAYSKFEYAREAIRHGVFDYILKPIDEELLLQTVSRCAGKVRAGKDQKQLAEEMHTEAIKRRDELLLRSLLQGKAPSDQEWEEIRKPGPDITQYPLAALIGIRSEALPFDASTFPPEWLSFILPAADLTLVLICMPPAPEETETARWWAGMTPPPGGDLITAFSARHTLSSCFDKAYAQVSFAMIAAGLARINLPGAPGKLVFFGDIWQAGIPRFPGFDNICLSIDRSIREGRKEDMPELLYTFFLGFLEKHVFYDLDLVRLYCIELIDHILREGDDCFSPKSPAEGSWDKKIKKNISACTSIEQIFVVTRETLEQFCLQIIESQSPGKTRFVRQALRYIHEHYGESISLPHVAEQLYISPNYLSRIFSAEMGESFSRYLLNHRIEQAKKLLRETYDKVYEIAEKVGYSDVVHFSKLFKQLTDMTPNQYRNNPAGTGSRP